MDGVYCESCDIAELARDTDADTADLGGSNDLSGVAPHAVDTAQAQHVWTLSEELTGVHLL
ncbi:hypothetical protein ACIBD9_18180 [Micromonospora sp. NPDC050784]|uniref:hypothetical protein n=1 Tax=Micromonospora sp. NPDC050784 TaxID=3364281 RepID=UPI0037B4C6A7